MGYAIEECFQRLSSDDVNHVLSGGNEFIDPLVHSLQSVSLSELINNELERVHTVSSPVEAITRVFRRFTWR